MYFFESNDAVFNNDTVFSHAVDLTLLYSLVLLVLFLCKSTCFDLPVTLLLLHLTLNLRPGNIPAERGNFPAESFLF